jgi:Bacterial transglutaminase-like N-terminal region
MLSVIHTEYDYASPVMLHDHRMMIRPRDSHDLRLLSAELSTRPVPKQLRWYHDVFGNSVVVVSFDVEADHLQITSRLLLKTYAPLVEAPQIAAYARAYPFSYTPEEQRDLGSLGVASMPTRTRGWRIGCATPTPRSSPAAGVGSRPSICSAG